MIDSVINQRVRGTTSVAFDEGARAGRTRKRIEKRHDTRRGGGRERPLD